jgi:4-hydroxy-tetrahydrodipicolinate synthase
MKKIYCASVSPFSKDNRPDPDSLERILDRNLKHGVSGAFILGTMGEWAQIDEDERDVFIRTASDVMKSRGELLVGISSNSLRATLKNLECAMKYEFDSFVVMLPGRRTSQLPPLDYLSEVFAASDRPVYYYHCPSNNGLELSMSEFRELVKNPKLKGIKNSAGNMQLRKELLMLKSEYDFMLLEGHEWSVDDALMAGCDGALCGIGSLASKPLVELARAVDAEDYSTARTLQHSLIKIFHGIYGTKCQTSWLGQKYALYSLGLMDSATCRVQPDSLLTPERKEEVTACLEKNATLLD